MATEDARFRQSSQFRLWSFSSRQLSDLRSKTNNLAKQSISERITTSSSSSSASATASANPSGSNTPVPTIPAASSAPKTVDASHSDKEQQQQQQQLCTTNSTAAASLPDFLSPAEEAQLLRFYTVELLRAADFCQLPTDVRATAAAFLRRFYVTNSIMTYPPTALLKTCLFFGAKAEGFRNMSLATFADKFQGTTSEEILAGEFLLCQGIRFAFDVRHPYRALEGAIMELRGHGDVDDKRIAVAHGRAREILKFSPLVTDAYFHYTPSQIMLAALSMADKILFEKFVQGTFPPQPIGNSESSSPASTRPAGGKPNKSQIRGQETRDKVMATIEACRDMLAQEPPERKEEYWGSSESNKVVKPLLRKLKKCRDPDRWDLVALQKTRREMGSAKETVAPKETVEDDGAVFGGGPVNSGDSRESKRRKVAADDLFGPPL